MRKLPVFIIAAVLISAALSLTWAERVSEVSRSSDDAPAHPVSPPAWRTRFFSAIPAGHSSESLRLKFKEDSEVRLRDGQFVSLVGEDVSEVNRAFRDHPIRRAERLFTRSEEALDEERIRIEQYSGREQPDKNLWYRVLLLPGADAVPILNLLNAIPIVEMAYPELLPAPTPIITPDFEGSQGYLNSDPDAVEARYAWNQPGGTGEFVKIVGIDYDWNEDHEDLTIGALIPNGTKAIPPLHDPVKDRNHGTALLGEMIADSNGFGVTGIAYGAELRMVNAYNSEPGDDLANAIDLAHANLSPGDVMMIEQQVYGQPDCCYVPVEWEPANYMSIKSAVDADITVVEPAGNGEQNLDDPYYATLVANDSGAIIVGAGGAPNCSNYLAGPRERVSDSTYGSRVNLQGWGECVATTGCCGLFNSCGAGTTCDLHDTGDPNQDYIATFGATSGAAPIVAASAALLSSVAQAACGGLVLTPRDIRQRLVATGTPQDVSFEHIGPLPDLEIALRVLLGRVFDVGSWPVEQYRDPVSFGDAVWELSKDNRVTTETQNSDASIRLSDVDASELPLRGTWRVEDTFDDDMVGIVFGYQDRGHFYLFDWKRSDQSDPLGFAEQGMSLKVVSKNSDPTGEDLWPTSGSPYVVPLRHNRIAWEPSVGYEWTLGFLPGGPGFRIDVFQGDTLLESWEVNDNTYRSGSFGFYNYSQANVIYTGGRDLTADCDGDGKDRATTDCNDANNGLWGTPVEVAGVRVSRTAGITSVGWTSQDGAAGPTTSYDLVSGLLSALRASGGYSGAICLADGWPDTPYQDGRGEPSSGDGYYYLARAQNGCGTGSYGDSTRLPDPRDLLDTGSPCP